MSSKFIKKDVLHSLVGGACRLDQITTVAVKTDKDGKTTHIVAVIPISQAELIEVSSHSCRQMTVEQADFE